MAYYDGEDAHFDEDWDSGMSDEDEDELMGRTPRDHGLDEDDED